MGRDKAFGDVVVPADALDSMISGLEENGKNCNSECNLPKYSLQEIVLCHGVAQYRSWYEIQQVLKGGRRFKTAHPLAKRHRHALKSNRFYARWAPFYNVWIVSRGRP